MAEIPANPSVDIKALKPFKRFIMTIGNLPTSYLESLTYAELVMWFCNFLQETVIPTVNNNGTAVEELQNLYIELKNYVDNYFTNLDVQEEINNKLDEMAEDGTLQEIIADYLNVRAVFGFDNISSMKLSTNLINGSFARTLGYYEKNDGGSALYKIREITNQDNVNEKTLIALNNENLVAELIFDNEINIKQLGAKGNNVDDDTDVFNFAQTLGYTIYVPKGKYVLNNFIFSTSITWKFQRSKNNPWFNKNDSAVIRTSTTTKITAGAKIYNLIIDYNGNVEDVSQRPSALTMLSHFCEIHGFFESYFNIGMDFGVNAGGHCDYTKIYDAYCWYNYFCGVYLHGSGNTQINFISFYDCNIGSNGVDAHDLTIEPNTSRGYGFYIGNCNSILINNGDFSANETCSLFIDNSTIDKQTRGLKVPVFYAEHNKYCDIYYNNGIDDTKCRSGNIEIDAPYLYHTPDDIFFVGQVHIASNYIPPCVKLINLPTSLKENKSFMLETIKQMCSIDNSKSLGAFKFTGRKNKKYKVSLTFIPNGTGTITFQNTLFSVKFNLPTNGAGYYANSNRIGVLTAFGVAVVENEEKTIDFYVQMPDSNTDLIEYRSASYGNTTGLNATITGGSIQEIDIDESTLSASNTPLNGQMRINNNSPQIYINGWKNLTIS